MKAGRKQREQKLREQVINELNRGELSPVVYKLHKVLKICMILIIAKLF